MLFPISCYSTLRPSIICCNKGLAFTNTSDYKKITMNNYFPKEPMLKPSFAFIFFSVFLLFFFYIMHNF